VLRRFAFLLIFYAFPVFVELVLDRCDSAAGALRDFFQGDAEAEQVEDVAGHLNGGFPLSEDHVVAVVGCMLLAVVGAGQGGLFAVFAGNPPGVACFLVAASCRVLFVELFEAGEACDLSGVRRIRLPLQWDPSVRVVDGRGCARVFDWLSGHDVRVTFLE